MGTITAITVKTTAAAAAAAVATTTSQDKKEEDENNLKQQQNFVLNLCLVSYFCFGIALHAPFVFTSVSFFFHSFVLSLFSKPV